MVSGFGRKLQNSFVYQHLCASDADSERFRMLELKKEQFVGLGLADKHFSSEYYSPNKEKFFQRLWEINLGLWLSDQGFMLESAEIGPDFSTTVNGKRLWIEAVSPTPQGILIDFFKVRAGDEFVVKDYPYNEIMLRVTSALSGKMRRYRDCLTGGIVSRDDCFVVAVDFSQLDFMAHIGISQMPTLVEAVYPVGPQYVSIDRDTLKQVGSGCTYKAEVKKVSVGGVANVEKDLFLRDEYACVSCALGAVSRVEGVIWSVLAHNVNAEIKMDSGILAVDKEYSASLDGDMLLLYSPEKGRAGQVR